MMGNDSYQDIINLPHHVSPTRKPMSMTERAAQFSPFAALTGFDGMIDETARTNEQNVRNEVEHEEFHDSI